MNQWLDLRDYLSILCLNFLKNFSLSSSATLKTLLIKFCLSFTSSFLTSTSLCIISVSWFSFSTKDFMILVLNLSYVGNFSMAAHLSASSSSFTLLFLLENTPSMLQLLLLMLPLMFLWLRRRPLVFSIPSIFCFF